MTDADATVELLYELLDAHADTVRILDELEPDLRRAAHADYLRRLQRVGRETLAQLSTPASRASR